MPGRFFRLNDELSIPLSPTVYGEMSAQSFNQLFANLNLFRGESLDATLAYAFELSVLGKGPLLDTFDSLSNLKDIPIFGPGDFGSAPQGFADLSAHIASLTLEYNIDDVIEGARLMGVVKGGHKTLHERSFIPLEARIGTRLFLEDSLDFSIDVGVATLSSEQDYPLEIVAQANLQLAEFPVRLKASRDLVVAPTIEPSIMHQIGVELAQDDKSFGLSIGTLEMKERSESQLFSLNSGDADVFVQGAAHYPIQLSTLTLTPYVQGMVYLSAREFDRIEGLGQLGTSANHTRVSGGLRISWGGSL